MSLVEYEASSDEEETSSNAVEDKESINNINLFQCLPHPKNGSETVVEEDDEFLKKKALSSLKPKTTVKISVPRLQDYESSDEDEPKIKKVKQQPKGSGLFAILPPPINTPLSAKSFVPHVVAKQCKKPVQKMKNKAPKKVDAQKKPSGDSDSDADDIDIPESFNEELWAKVCGQQPKRRVVQEISAHTPKTEIEIAPETSKPYTGLDNKGFKQLVGKIRKQKQEEIEIREIREEDILPDKDVWMLKAITDPTQEPKSTEENPVNDTCKRKHHITYLAQQAKANEQDLKNQWAANKSSRMQSRSKYGF